MAAVLVQLLFGVLQKTFGGILMTSQEVKRRLAAILSEDVKSYSRLMEKNETATVQTLTSYREILAHFIRQHQGRVVDSPGDNLLAEFTSVVEAVQCGVEIQERGAERLRRRPTVHRQVHPLRAAHRGPDPRRPARARHPPG